MAQLLASDLLRWVLNAAYLGVLGVVCIYGLHRYWLVYLFWRHRQDIPRPARRFDQLPAVTVQLPMYNEPKVGRRAINAACRLDYPRHLLQIQVLDDSTDGSAEWNEQRCRRWSRLGVNVQYVRRTNRHGFKAGALEAGLASATGQFIAIFDADFVVPPNFLRRTIHYFTDESVGMVQARWSHLNRNDSLLTRCQAIFLDGHFLIEHTARNRARRWINFNGTAGIWRRRAIESAGGWQHDTLTEDVDLSYRAQLAGWRFVFLPRLACPAELPPEIEAFKSQQHRWTKGSVQTAKKLLPTLLRSGAPARVKLEAFFHLTSPAVYLLVTALAVLFYPVIYVNLHQPDTDSWVGTLLGLSLFALGTLSAGTFYIVSQRAQKRNVWATILQMPLLMAIGIGIALNNARACLEALVGHPSPFVRTPKYNCQPRKGAGWRGPEHAGGRPFAHAKILMPLAELGMGAYMLGCAVRSMELEFPIVSTPFMLLFAAGYFYVGLSTLAVQWPSRSPFRHFARAS